MICLATNPALLLFALLLGACSSTSVDQACADWAAARCAKLSTCTGGAGITQRWGDVSTCTSREKLDCLNRLGAPDQSNNPAATEACAMALPSQDCGGFLIGNLSGACAVKGGPRADGAGCIAGGQCQSTYCAFMGDACGQCSAQPQAGDACMPGECGGGLYCPTDALTCQVPVPEGGGCDKDHFCAPDLSCTGATAMSGGTCQKSLATAGAACDPLQHTTPACDFRLGLYCNAMTRQCQAASYAAGGRPCGVLADGSTALCRGGGLCVLAKGAVTGVCRAAAIEGMECDDTAGPPCLFPARCVTTGSRGTCTIPDGAKCQ